VLSVCDVGVLWPNGWTYPLGAEVGFGPSDVVLDGDPVPRSLKRRGVGHSPRFSAHVYCGQTAVCNRIPLGTDVGFSLGDIVYVIATRTV